MLFKTILRTKKGADHETDEMRLNIWVRDTRSVLVSMRVTASPGNFKPERRNQMFVSPAYAETTG